MEQISYTKRSRLSNSAFSALVTLRTFCYELSRIFQKFPKQLKPGCLAPAALKTRKGGVWMAGPAGQPSTHHLEEKASRLRRGVQGEVAPRKETLVWKIRDDLKPDETTSVPRPLEEGQKNRVGIDISSFYFYNHYYLLRKGEIRVKIHVLGAPGSGKTTLAQDVAFRFHIPHYDLDKINLKQESAITIAEQPAWITEGIYLISTEPMLYHADYIVLLEVSWPVAAWRMMRRHILNSLHGTNPYPGINGVKALFKLLKGARRYILNLDHANTSSVEALYIDLETHRKWTTPPTEDFLKAYSETYQELTIPPTEEFVRMYLARYKEKLFLLRNTTDRERLLEFLAKR